MSAEKCWYLDWGVPFLGWVYLVGDWISCGPTFPCTCHESRARIVCYPPHSALCVSLLHSADDLFNAGRHSVTASLTHTT
jgi:hypothetical protein